MGRPEESAATGPKEVGPSAPPPTYDEAINPPFNPQFMGSAPAQPACQVPVPMPMPMPQVVVAAPYPQQPGTVVTEVQVQSPPQMMGNIVYGNLPVGPKSMRLECPFCRATVQTKTDVSSQCSAHLCCILLCLIGCWCCWCLPYCMNSFKLVAHTCPKCKAHLGTYKV